MAELPGIKQSNRVWSIWSACLGIQLLLFGAGAAAEAADLSLHGYYKSYLFFYRPPADFNMGNGGAAPSLIGLWSNRFRLHFSYRPNAWMNMDAAYDIVPRIQSPELAELALLFGQLDPFSYRAVDLKQRLHPEDPSLTDPFVLSQNLDRAAIVFHARDADIIVGRQAIAWGNARVVNPTDVLAPFTFDTLDTEDRIGIDAVRARIPLGALSEIDAGYIFGKHLKFKNSAFYGRAKFNVSGTDIALLVMDFRENMMAGFDMARSFGGAGFWLETAYVFVDALAGGNAGQSRDYFRVSSGMDYTFTPKTYAFMEYHFNGAGASLARDYLRGLSGSAYTEGSVYLMGRHYLIPGVSYQLSPLITLTGQCLVNVTDPSAYMTPQVEYNITQNAYVGGGAFVGIGKKPVVAQGQNPVLLRSEFGGYPNIYFGSVRYYF
jgi:hypothetical protein